MRRAPVCQSGRTAIRLTFTAVDGFLRAMPLRPVKPALLTANCRPIPLKEGWKAVLNKKLDDLRSALAKLRCRGTHGQWARPFGRPAVALCRNGHYVSAGAAQARYQGTAAQIELWGDKVGVRLFDQWPAQGLTDEVMWSCISETPSSGGLPYLGHANRRTYQDSRPCLDAQCTSIGRSARTPAIRTRLGGRSDYGHSSWDLPFCVARRHEPRLR